MKVEVEISPSNRSVCQMCNNKIKLGDLRLAVEIPNGKFITTLYYCKKCGNKYLTEVADEIQELFKELSAKSKNENEKGWY